MYYIDYSYVVVTIQIVALNGLTSYNQGFLKTDSGTGMAL